MDLDDTSTDRSTVTVGPPAAVRLHRAAPIAGWLLQATLLFGLGLGSDALGANEPELAQAPAPRGYTAERIDAHVPTWPNPFLSFLPVGAQPDMAYWKARMHKESLERRHARLLRKATRGPEISVVEAEADDDRYKNDHPLTAEAVDGFGSTSGMVPAARIVGHLRPLPRDLPAAPEPNGAIQLATPLDVAAGERIRIQGEIGDGQFGSGTATPSGDFDFFSLDAAAGETVEVIVRTPVPLGDLNPVVGVFSAGGQLLQYNDNIPEAGFITTLDSYLLFRAPEEGEYVVVVGGWSPQWWGLWFPSDPFDPSTGPGAGSEGSYELIVGYQAPDPGDQDLFRLQLRAGDVLGASVVHGARRLTLRDTTNADLVGSWGGDLSAIYPSASPLNGSGGATIAWVVHRSGPYLVGVASPSAYADGEYELEVTVHRGPLDGSDVPGNHQVLYLDFDGATVDPQSDLGYPSGSPRALSPLNQFLGRWELSQSEEENLIRRIIEVTRENLSDDVRLLGGNGDFTTDGIPGAFVVELRNSLDDSDPWGQPDTSRVVVGGTIDELGIATVGIAGSVDPGNFDTRETAVVLLDLLSGPDDEPTSLNGIERSPAATKMDLIARVVGNIVAHEAGHLFGNFHTERDEGPFTIMDQGGHLENMIGFGDDEVFGTGDDLDIDLGPDEYSRAEVFDGSELTLEVVSWDLPAGGSRAEILVTPDGCDFGALPLGSTADCTLTIRNAGDLELRLDDASLGGGQPEQFSVDIAAPIAIAAGGELEGVVSYSPTSFGTHQTTLTVASNDPRAASLVLPMIGDGGTPQASVTPGDVDLGEVVYGDTPAELLTTITVSNAGDGELRVTADGLTGADPELFGVASGGTPFSLGPGESAETVISFAPGGVVGPASAIFILSCNDPAASQLQVTLRAGAHGPDITINPSTEYAFGAIDLGESRSRIFQLGNAGDRELLVYSTSLDGEYASEIEITEGQGTFAIPPGANHNLVLRWTPSSLGERDATLLVTSNDPDQPLVEVQLSTEAVAPEILVEPEQCVFPWTLDLSPVRCSVRVHNLGGSFLHVIERHISGSNAEEMRIISGPDELWLAEGESWPIEVELVPTSPGAKSAELVIVSNALDQPVLSVPLLGRAGPQNGIPTLGSLARSAMICMLIAAAWTLLRRR